MVSQHSAFYANFFKVADLYLQSLYRSVATPSDTMHLSNCLVACQSLYKYTSLCNQLHDAKELTAIFDIADMPAMWWR